MTLSYIREVGNLLALTSSVRESIIERHLQAERLTAPDEFAFGNPNYGRYLTHQHVMLNNLHLENPGGWEELVKEDFGGSLSGQPFSAEHGDLIIETTINRETKVHYELTQGGHSRNLSAMKEFVKKTHLLIKLRAAVKNKLRVLTSSKHKETMFSGKRLHELTIASMGQQLGRYLIHFMSNQRGISKLKKSFRKTL